MKNYIITAALIAVGASFLGAGIGAGFAAHLGAARGEAVVAVAAWVQALGAIGAIIGAICISRDNSDRQDRERLAQAKSLAVGFLLEIPGFLERLERFARDTTMAATINGMKDGGLATAEGILRLEMPGVFYSELKNLHLLTGRGAEEMQQAIRCIQAYNGRIYRTLARRPLPSPADVEAALGKLREQIHQHVSEAQRKMDALVVG